MSTTHAISVPFFLFKYISLLNYNFSNYKYFINQFPLIYIYICMSCHALRYTSLHLSLLIIFYLIFSYFYIFFVFIFRLYFLFSLYVSKSYNFTFEIWIYLIDPLTFKTKSEYLVTKCATFSNLGTKNYMFFLITITPILQRFMLPSHQKMFIWKETYYLPNFMSWLRIAWWFF